MNAKMTRSSVTPWKAKQIERDCHLSDDVVTMHISRMVDDVTFAAHKIELLMCGSY